METKGEGRMGLKAQCLNALVLGSLQDIRNSHLHHLWATTDGLETHPLTNLEWHTFLTSYHHHLPFNSPHQCFFTWLGPHTVPVKVSSHSDDQLCSCSAQPS